MDNDVSEDVLAGVMDNSDTEVPNVMREEGKKAVVKLKSGKAEPLKSGREAMVDWLTELARESCCFVQSWHIYFCWTVFPTPNGVEVCALWFLLSAESTTPSFANRVRPMQLQRATYHGLRLFSTIFHHPP